MKVTVAITGASGTIYAKKLIAELSNSPQVSRISVVMTTNGRAVAEHELGEKWKIDEVAKVICYENADFFTPIASGSAAADVMVIIPCSMGMVGRIAAGVSDDLVSRAADVMLKERLPLIIVPRESPMSLIHLRNLTLLTESGAIILPASPSFYHNPTTIDELVTSVVERVLKQIGIDKANSYKWKE